MGAVLDFANGNPCIAAMRFPQNQVNWHYLLINSHIAPCEKSKVAALMGYGTIRSAKFGGPKGRQNPDKARLDLNARRLQDAI